MRCQRIPLGIYFLVNIKLIQTVKDFIFNYLLLENLEAYKWYILALLKKRIFKGQFIGAR